LFGAEAYKHWAILLDTGSGKLKDMTKNLQNCDGTAARMAATMLDNLYGSLEIFKSAAGDVAIHIGQHFLPMIRKGVDALAKFAESLGKIDPKKVEIFVKMAGTAVGILATAGAISKLAGALRTLVLGMGPIGWVITGLSVLGSVIVGVKTATEQTKTIDLEHIKELEDKTRKVEDLTSQYDKMRDQIKLTSPELMHYRELQQDAARETDPKKVEEYTKEMEGLEKKSGLSREQLEKFFEVNDNLIDILPKAEVKIDKHGKALLENSKSAKECVDQLKELAETEAKHALIDVENNYDKHIRDYEAALKDTSDAAQTLNDKRI
ncbi:phage tail tape measure protein, partial [Paenibacillus larvae]